MKVFLRVLVSLAVLLVTQCVNYMYVSKIISGDFVGEHLVLVVIAMLALNVTAMFLEMIIWLDFLKRTK